MREAKASIFVCRVTPRIRAQLGDAAVNDSNSGSSSELWKAVSEQGYTIRSHGEPCYHPIDLDGLALIGRPCQKRLNSLPQHIVIFNM